VPGTLTLTVLLPEPHAEQRRILESQHKRIMVRAGRRAGKTVTAVIKAVKAFLAGQRVLYATPTAEQLEKFWYEAVLALQAPIQAGVFTKNETLRAITRAGTENRLRAKTAWNADTLRGDYADLLILDEFQLMKEDAWQLVGAPMLLDNNGAAMLIYTPPSLFARSASRAHDPQHAAKMFRAGQAAGTWECHSFSSHVNPHISSAALQEITQYMTPTAYRQEIMAEDMDTVPGALWTAQLLEQTRVSSTPALARRVVGVDPPGGATECGIVVAGRGLDGQYYIVADHSLRASPDKWALAVLDADADTIVAEHNYGGDMVAATISQAAQSRGRLVRYKDVVATRGKAVRAEPVAALFEQGRCHIVGSMPQLEQELTMWVPGESHSPNRLDALVWAVTELLTVGSGIRVEGQPEMLTMRGVRWPTSHSRSRR